LRQNQSNFYMFSSSHSRNLYGTKNKALPPASARSCGAVELIDSCIRIECRGNIHCTAAELKPARPSKLWRDACKDFPPRRRKDTPLHNSQCTRGRGRFPPLISVGIVIPMPVHKGKHVCVSRIDANSTVPAEEAQQAET
jgi:hypothetical protein